MKTKDSVMDELWKVRESNARRYGNDVRAFCDDLQKLPRIEGVKYVRRQPRRLLQKSA